MKTWKVSALACAVLTWGAAWAAPGLINYQGRLTDSSGNPIIGVVNVTFTFWDAEIGGTQLGAGFSDTDTVTTDADGIYSTEIGDDPGTLIPASVFSGDSVWLNVNVESEDLSPRLRITSDGFAIHAAQADAADIATTATYADTATTATNADTVDDRHAADFLNMSADAYVVVKTTSDATQNGANLLAAYAAAKGLTPNGAALSATNRAAVIIPPGNYDLGTSFLTIDTDFVDVVGLSSARDDQYVFGMNYVLYQTASDVRIENLLLEYTGPSSHVVYQPDATWNAGAKRGSPPQTVIRNCEFRDPVYYGMRVGSGIEYAGQYENCYSTADGCFGGMAGIASGTFTNCNLVASAFSFGGNHGVASGTFINCTAGSSSFAGSGTASGTFVNCTGGNYAFGGGGIYGIASGTFTNCVGGGYSFGGNGGSAGGTFIGCIGGADAFGGNGGTASGGKFYHCVGGANSFTETGATAPVQFFCVQDGAQYAGNN